MVRQDPIRFLAFLTYCGPAWMNIAKIRWVPVVQIDVLNFNDAIEQL